MRLGVWLVTWLASNSNDPYKKGERQAARGVIADQGRGNQSQSDGKLDRFDGIKLIESAWKICPELPYVPFGPLKGHFDLVMQIGTSYMVELK